MTEGDSPPPPPPLAPEPPPAPVPAPAPAPLVPRWPVARLRQVGSGLWGLAAVLALVGTFAPLIELRSVRQQLVITTWGSGGNPLGANYPAFGVPIVVVAALLLVAAGLGLTSTRLHPASGAVLASRLIGTGSAGGLAAATSTLYLFTTLFQNDSLPDGSISFHTGLGMWLLIGASVVALGAIALMLIPRVAQYDPDPETPPMGIPVVRVLEPEFDETEPKA
jgi:hypothetical protein